MGVSIVDLMVHVNESISPEEMHRLEDAVKTDSCVISACTSTEDSHMLMVTYNPACTSSGKILDKVSAQGLHAQLVCL